MRRDPNGSDRYGVGWKKLVSSAMEDFQVQCQPQSLANGVPCCRPLFRRSITAITGALCLLLWIAEIASAAPESAYFPPPGEWERRDPETQGFDSAMLQTAIGLAQSLAQVAPADLSLMIEDSWGDEPYFDILGPVKERAGSSGLVIKNGYIVAEWGDLERVDMTFSVTKSYLSSVLGLALDRRLIDAVDDSVSEYVELESLADSQNRHITWRHLLQQHSEWAGALWGIPDWADRPLSLDPDKAMQRQLGEPGDVFEYNDVRVNLLALAALHVWRQPLAEVLRTHIMNPIGASQDWEWHGYRNSWVDIDGESMQSVSGGGHWGGGLFISTLDHARFGYLLLRNGDWDGEQLISTQWIRDARRPSRRNPNYGYMWLTNFGNLVVAEAPSNAFYASGAGGNHIWIDQENDLLIVLRWIPDLSSAVGAITAAIAR